MSFVSNRPQAGFSIEAYSAARGIAWPPYPPMNVTLEYNSLEDMWGTSEGMEIWRERMLGIARKITIIPPGSSNSAGSN